MEILLRLARKSAALLDESPCFASFADLTQLCRDRFIQSGFASSSGRLRLQALTDAAENRLAQLRNLFPEASSTAWLVAMGRKHRHAFSPLQHLLLDLVLESGAAPPARSRTQKRRFLANDIAFEERLRQAAKEAQSLREAARLVGVDPHTILKHAHRLRLEGPWRLKPVPEPTPASDDARGEEARRRWLEIWRPGVSRTQMRRARPADWVWLRRHGPLWLETHSPPALQRESGGPRKDWPMLDAELSEEIFKAVSAIRIFSPPRRVTRGEIERHIQRQAWFGPRLSKLPLCRSALEASSETLEEFRLRRIAWARAALLTQGVAPQSWRILRLAGLRPHLTPALRSALTRERTS